MIPLMLGDAPASALALVHPGIPEIKALLSGLRSTAG